MNGGIFRYLYLGSHNFTAKDLILENFDVTAVKNSAAFAAEINWTNGSSGNTCNLSNILVDGGTISSSHPQGNSGGLIGYTGVKSIVKNCAAVVKSVATGARIPEKENYKYAGDAGGLIGEINSKGSLVENCYSGGMTKDGVYKHDDPSDYNVRGVDMAGGLIGKLNGKSNTIDNCYSTCSVYVANSGEPGISYAGGLVGGELSSSDKGTHTYKDCYAIGFVGGDDSAKRGAFIGNAASSSSTYTGCKFLMGINPVSVRASGSGNLSGVFETPVGDLKVEDINETHEKDPALKGKMYPFATVNKTGMTRYDNQAAKGVHYGDWQELDEEAVTGGLLFAYRETVENKDYWYIVKAEKNAAGTEYSTVANTLLKKENTYVDDDNCNYGYLSDQNQINSLFDKETKKLKDLVNTNGEKVGNVDELEGEYYFFQVNNSVEQDSDGIVEMPEAKDEISFYFNPDFAAAIGAESDLGTQKTPYQVRTNQQLRNIAKGGYENVYRDKDYSQSLDIKLTKESFKPFGGAAFTGTYNALYKDEQGYEINNFTQNINGEGKKAGLITEIGSKGKVSYVNLHGEITAKETYNHIGSLTGSMRGTAEGCYSDVSLEIDNNNRYSGGDINIGGLVGYVMPEAIMEGCHYLTIYNTSGSPFSVDNSVPNSINIGGLVGYNSGIITNSSAEVKISSTPYNVQGQVGVGGFVGKNTNGGKISYSWAKTLFEMSVVDNNASFGSFAGIISGDAEISNSYAILNWCSASASGAFVGKNGIGENDSSIVQNCHAVELDNWNNMNLNSSLKFVDGNSLKEDANCYRYHNSYSSEPGVKYILTLADYKTLSKFTGFDDSIWEVTNDKYPTLIANPEPKVSKARAQSIFKRSLEENLQPKLDIDNEPFQELDNAG